MPEILADQPATPSAPEPLPRGIGNLNTPPSAPSVPVPMEKVTVRASKQSEQQLKDLAKALHPDEIPPSFQNGAMIKRKFGGREIEMGARKNEDLFKEDAKYKDKTPMIKIDFLRLKF